MTLEEVTNLKLIYIIMNGATQRYVTNALTKY